MKYCLAYKKRVSKDISLTNVFMKKLILILILLSITQTIYCMELIRKSNPNGEINYLYRLGKNQGNNQLQKQTLKNGTIFIPTPTEEDGTQTIKPVTKEKGIQVAMFSNMFLRKKGQEITYNRKNSNKKQETKKRVLLPTQDEHVDFLNFGPDYSEIHDKNKKIASAIKEEGANKNYKESPIPTKKEPDLNAQDNTKKQFLKPRIKRKVLYVMSSVPVFTKD